MGGQVEVTRLRVPRGLPQVGLESLPGRAIPLEVVVAFRKAQRHQLAIVTRRHTRERLKSSTSLGPPARSKQLLGAGQRALNAIRGDERRRLQAPKARLRHRCLRAERKVEVHALVGPQRLVLFARRLQRSAETNENLFSRGQDIVTQIVQDLDGALGVVLRERRFRHAKRKPFFQIAFDAAVERRKRRGGLARPFQTEQRDPGVVPPVRRQQRPGKCGARDERQPGSKFPVGDERGAARELSGTLAQRGVRGGVGRGRVGHQPIQRQAAG